MLRRIKFFSFTSVSLIGSSVENVSRIPEIDGTQCVVRERFTEQVKEKKKKKYGLNKKEKPPQNFRFLFHDNYACNTGHRGVSGDLRMFPEDEHFDLEFPGGVVNSWP